ncbi:MAG: hypothetical protein ACM3VT_03410, partial [Solirubrobacterales bacterium]
MRWNHTVGLASHGLATEAAAPYSPEQASSLIRSAVLALTGEQDLQTAFAGIIPAGSTVLLKPNWVLHYNQGGHTMDCMITHPVFIEAVLD